MVKGVLATAKVPPPTRSSSGGRRDTLSYPNAVQIARRIEEVWRKYGYEGIRAWVEKLDLGTKQPLWVVRSNCVNGIPPREAPKTSDEGANIYG